MKRILLIGILGFGLVLSGCKDHKVGLDKNIINTAYDDCFSSLESIVRSPSSLKVNNVAVGSLVPTASYVYRVFGKELVDRGLIDGLASNKSLGFRGLSVEINYDAQNSYGVYLRNTFECRYLYEISDKSESPSRIVLSKITTKDDESDFNKSIDNFTEASNFTLNSAINKTYGVSSSLGSIDSKVLNDVVDLNKATISKPKIKTIDDEVAEAVAAAEQASNL